MEEDESEAVRLYKLSAEVGDANGQMRYAYCFEEGQEGVTEDLIAARKWFLKAAAQGNKEAHGLSIEIGRRMLRSVLDSDSLKNLFACFDTIDADNDGNTTRAEFHHAMVTS